MCRETTSQNFSQRNGYEVMPEQLKLGQVSSEFRNLAWYSIRRMIVRDATVNFPSTMYGNIMEDCHVKFFNGHPDQYNNRYDHWHAILERFVMKTEFNKVFDLIEFFINHLEFDDDLKLELVEAFIQARMAYRLIDSQVIPIGNPEQADAVLQAISDTEKSGYSGARQYLIDAGKKLTKSDWKGSVRDSIHSVEATAKFIAPNESSLGGALKKIEKNGDINPRLKSAFDKLYAYTNEGSTGVRHAEIHWNSDVVDEADALFMLGTCASFVSWLIAKTI